MLSPGRVMTSVESSLTVNAGIKKPLSSTAFVSSIAEIMGATTASTEPFPSTVGVTFSCTP